LVCARYPHDVGAAAATLPRLRARIENAVRGQVGAVLVQGDLDRGRAGLVGTYVEQDPAEWQGFYARGHRPTRRSRPAWRRATSRNRSRLDTCSTLGLDGGGA